MNYQQYDYHLENLFIGTPGNLTPTFFIPLAHAASTSLPTDLIKGNRLPFPEYNAILSASFIKTYFFQKFLLYKMHPCSS